MRTEAQKRIVRGIENIPDHPGQAERWPPPWLRSATPAPKPVFERSEPQKKGVQSTVSPPVESPSSVGPTESPIGSNAAVSDELESILKSLMDEVHRLTTDEVLIRAATNLMEDCRAVCARASTRRR